MRMNAPNLTTLGRNPSTSLDETDKTLALRTVPLHLAEEVRCFSVFGLAAILFLFRLDYLMPV